MNSADVRAESIRTASRLGIQVPAHLPLLAIGARVPGPHEAVSRLLVLNAMAAIACGFDRSRAVAWLEQEALADRLTPAEHQFVFDGVGSRAHYQVQVERMWVLAWAMGIAHYIDFDREADNDFVRLLPNLKVSESSGSLRKNARARSMTEVLRAGDLAYCLHWAVRDAQVKGTLTAALKSHVVIERRHALDWLLEAKPWDGVPLDT